MTKKRCFWLNLGNSAYVEYHDREWGRPVREDDKHFECITLEGAQAGLSWETVLNKRERYREVFHQFNVERVAGFGASDVKRLMQDSGIIRNRLKIESTISNARCILEVQKEFGTFDQFIWGLTGPTQMNSYQDKSDYSSQTPKAKEVSKELKRRGFRFVGPTIVYAYMQAAGMVQDHARDCFLHGKKIRAL